MNTCFVISPIGAAESQTRKNSDAKLKYIYRDVLEKMGYVVERADTIEEAGSISQDIVKNIIESDLVIADISENNPNVFYELAIRNAVSKPYILIKEPKQKIPFDIKDIRAIDIDLKDISTFLTAKDLLKKQVESTERDPEKASHSILSLFDLCIISKQQKIKKKTAKELSEIANKAANTRRKNKLNSKKNYETKKDAEILKFKKENTIICPSREEGLKFFLKTQSWNAVKIWHERIPYIKYIALYEAAPVSAIRYYGKVQQIKPYKGTDKGSGKYEIILKAKPQKLQNPIVLGGSTKVPQASRFTSMLLLRKGKTISDIFK